MSLVVIKSLSANVAILLGLDLVLDPKLVLGQLPDEVQLHGLLEV